MRIMQILENFYADYNQLIIYSIGFILLLGLIRMFFLAFKGLFENVKRK